MQFDELTRREFIMLLGGTGIAACAQRRAPAEFMWGGARDRMDGRSEATQGKERMIARRLILGAAIAAGVLGVAPKVAAQGYPEKPIKLIVPFPAGGPIDTMARFLTQALGTRLRQSIVIENRPGGGATIATRFVAASPPTATLCCSDLRDRWRWRPHSTALSITTRSRRLARLPRLRSCSS
jgi:hypothetical protein